MHGHSEFLRGAVRHCIWKKLPTRQFVILSAAKDLFCARPRFFPWMQGLRIPLRSIQNDGTILPNSSCAGSAGR